MDRSRKRKSRATRKQPPPPPPLPPPPVAEEVDDHAAESVIGEGELPPSPPLPVPVASPDPVSASASACEKEEAMALFEQMRANVGKLLKGIDRYNPENLATLERYVETQAKENAYDLEANLAVLKLYQFNPAFFQTTVTAQILLKALTNLPHTDFTLCKCMIDQARQEEQPIRQILYLGDLLETCHFQAFWHALDENMDLLLLNGITGFEDSVRKFICHVVGITYQHIDRWLLAEMLGDLSDNQLKVWMSKYGWSSNEAGQVFICSQEESIKPKNIVEKIDFESVSSIMASSQ
ncbi:eukaryotic translation initiation factor 3 subunit K [Notamacropus eugenii]|uniref:eukaryotic translation initiation factor 3 subunit K n=1 Tax=Notamacropus eugenii TaxID=9315 RepID=UPI003B67A3C0